MGTITMSHFKPWDVSNGAELVANWLQNSLIDYLSPQLYTQGTEPANSWVDFNPAFADSSAVPKIIPSIVKSTYYATVPITVAAKLPNAVGYIQWQDPILPGPGSVPGCVSSTFSGVGCDSMCNWCEQQLG